MTIDLWSSWNFASKGDIRKKMWLNGEFVKIHIQ